LRVKLGVFAGEMRVKIGIALPEGLLVAVVDSRIAIVGRLIDCVAATRQTVTV